MQALRRAASGTRASSSAGKLAWVHQQGDWGAGVAPAVQAMTQRLGWPHSGHRAGSGEEVGAVWDTFLPV